MNPRIGFLPQFTGAKVAKDAEFSEALSKNRDDRDIAILSVYYRMAQEGFNARFDFGITQAQLERLGFTWD